MPFATTQGCRIYYRLEGSAQKPLLVLAHALGTDHGLWDPQMPALLRYFQVLRLDLRGHGASDATAGDYTIAQLAGDVLATVPRERFSYCGLSVGGMIGQWLGANHAQRIERLVLANTSPRVADPSQFEVRRKTVLTKGLVAIEPAVMGRFFSSPGNAAADSIRATLLATDATGYAGCCAAIRDMDHRPLLPRIAVPTLVIGGDADVSTPWTGHGEVLASQIPAARAVKIDAAHLSNVERPSTFTNAVLEFLLPDPPADRLEAGFSRASSCSRRCACRSLHRECQRLYPRVSGPDHALCLGYDLDAPGPRSTGSAAAGNRNHRVAGTLGGVSTARPGWTRRRTRTGRPERSSTASRDLRRST